MEGTFVITPEGIIPKTNAMVGFIREISTKEELEELMERMPYITTISAPKEALQKYDCTELFGLIKCLYFRKQERLKEGKKPTAVDEKYMKLAEEVLYQELGVVLDIPKDQVLDHLFERIEKGSDA